MQRREQLFFSLLYFTAFTKQGLIVYYGLAIDRNMAAAKLKTRIMSALVSTASKACVPVTHQQPLTETTGKKKQPKKTSSSLSCLPMLNMEIHKPLVAQEGENSRRAN